MDLDNSFNLGPQQNPYKSTDQPISPDIPSKTTSSKGTTPPVSTEKSSLLDKFPFGSASSTKINNQVVLLTGNEEREERISECRNRVLPNSSLSASGDIKKEIGEDEAQKRMIKKEIGEDLTISEIQQKRIQEKELREDQEQNRITNKEIGEDKAQKRTTDKEIGEDIINQEIRS